MSKELRNGLSLADNDIIRGGLGLVTDKEKKKKTEPPARTVAYGARLKKKKTEPAARTARLRRAVKKKKPEPPARTARLRRAVN